MRHPHRRRSPLSFTLAAALLALACAPALSQAQEAGGAGAGGDDGVVAPGEAADRPTPPGAQEPDRDEVARRLEALLSGYEYFPDRAALDRLGSARLIASLGREIARDASKRPTLRLRAVDMLGYYDDAKTVALLEELVKTETDGLPASRQRTRLLMRHRAMTALARSQGEEALGVLEEMMRHGDLQLQLSAVSAVGKHGGASGKALLEARAKDARHPALKRELGKYVRVADD